MSERKLERFVYENGKPTARTNDQGGDARRSCGASWLWLSPNARHSRVHRPPRPRVASHATNEGREMKSESQRKLRGAAE